MDEIISNEEKKSLDEDQIQSIMSQLFQATEYLHGKGICHRDLKPDNIMVKNSSYDNTKLLQVKIIDFNVATEVDPDTQKVKGGKGLREWSAPETR